VIPIGSIQFGVIAGHSPSKTGVNALVTRQSILFAKRLHARRMDRRIKSAVTVVVGAAPIQIDRSTL
jgi:hypothetical protein